MPASRSVRCGGVREFGSTTRIAAVVKTEYIAGDMRPAESPDQASEEIDATGMYVLPGFVDLHLHSGDIPKTPEAEYVYKLWLAHGITKSLDV